MSAVSDYFAQFCNSTNGCQPTKNDANLALVYLACNSAFYTFSLLSANSELITLSTSLVKTLTIPAGAVGAILQLQENTGMARVTRDVTVPTNSTGEQIAGLQQISIGRTPLTPNGSISELANFKAILEAGATGKLYVRYYSSPAG